MTGLLLCTAGLAGRPVAAQALTQTRRESPALGEALDGAFQDAVRPAYRLVEGVADGVYDLTRRYVVGNLVPGRFSRNLLAAPGQDSGELFAANLRARETDLFRRARETYPVAASVAGPEAPSLVRDWRARIVEEEQGVVVSALADTLLQRYRVPSLGRASETYIKDARNWDAGSLTMAGLLSGAAFYANGLHANLPVGEFRVRVDLRPGQCLRRALDGDTPARGWAAVELGFKGNPVTLALEGGVDGGRARAESAGVKYRLRY